MRVSYDRSTRALTDSNIKLEQQLQQALEGEKIATEATYRARSTFEDLSKKYVCTSSFYIMSLILHPALFLIRLDETIAINQSRFSQEISMPVQTIDSVPAYHPETCAPDLGASHTASILPREGVDDTWFTSSVCSSTSSSKPRLRHQEKELEPLPQRSAFKKSKGSGQLSDDVDSEGISVCEKCHDESFGFMVKPLRCNHRTLANSHV